VQEVVEAAPQKLITINLDTYKASKVNSMLSRLRMRIEPIENWEAEVHKKEATERKLMQAKNKEDKKLRR